MEESEATFLELIKQLSPLQIGGIALAVVLLALGLRLIFRKPPAHLTAFAGNAGSVLVSRKALQELVRSACLLEEWVEAARPVIRVKNNQVTARVELRLSKPNDLKAVCERVQEHITALLQKSLSFDQIGEIQIVVKSFGKDTEETGNEIPVPLPPSTETSVLSNRAPIPEPPAREEEDKPSDPKA